MSEKIQGNDASAPVPSPEEKLAELLARATPRPWRRMDWTASTIVTSDTCKVCSLTNKQRKVSADLIVRAVNSFESLLASLKDMALLCKVMIEEVESVGCEQPEARHAWEKATKAISDAEAQP